ncbi:DUF447 domain-containing protein [Halomarina ordinaria]|uniref:DUF447 domain-containing protein n=1 Tax=Halomarina ordinaria TaxID=3033939 RepID=A0ABD5U4J2_9EURY|nr:DUF447 domain-containing protein [Halomarina sp. PSRA2]
MNGSDDLAGWPVALAGVTESVVTTLGPNERWNVAALGLFAPEDGGPVTARTWGRTRTWRNFRERGEGYVQFTRDPVDFVEAACSVREEDAPVLDGADAWAHVTVAVVDAGEESDTEWTEWELVPVEAAVERRVVPTTNRARAAVVEATVAASRLGVAGYDDEVLRERIRYFESVVDACAGARERAAWERFEELVAWRP